MSVRPEIEVYDERHALLELGEARTTPNKPQGSGGRGSGRGVLRGGHPNSPKQQQKHRQQQRTHVMFYGTTPAMPPGGVSTEKDTLTMSERSVCGSDDRDDDCYNNNNNYNSSSFNDDNDESEGSKDTFLVVCCGKCRLRFPSLRRLALFFSLYLNVAITIAKFVAYIQSRSLSVLAALLDSLLDILSQLVLNYTEKHSSMQRSSAFYPAGASRLEPIGVLTCAALMGMASFEVLKEATTSLLYFSSPLADELSLKSFWNMLSVILVKLALLWLCNRGAKKRVVLRVGAGEEGERGSNGEGVAETSQYGGGGDDDGATSDVGDGDVASAVEDYTTLLLQSGNGNKLYPRSTSSKAVVQLADPTLEALAQDHFNDILSNSVAAGALLVALRQPNLWFLDPVGAILISLYIIYSWYQTGREQIEQLTGKSAPADLIDELEELARNFDERMEVDVVRAYHFGPKFLVEIECVMHKNTLLFESHDVGMELQYEIESREEVERCFVHIDYQQRPYDEHVVSKVPELREKYRPKKQLSVHSL